ncbi:MAG TPA: LamG domain-containing protein [Candidatus Pacearchaeota archaeon]|nr:LamG domain-containing protein [Candidatus Pacearchaeota archaeon]
MKLVVQLQWTHGGGSNGTISTVTFKGNSDCVTNGCFEFNQTLTSYVEIADNPELRLNRGGTISAWIYPKGLGTSSIGRIIDKSSTLTGTGGYVFHLNASNQISLTINNGAVLSSANNAITLNKWQFVTATFTDTMRKIYVDGIEKASATTSIPLSNTAGAIRIANRPGATVVDAAFNGSIDDIRLYNAPLSLSQIRQDYVLGLEQLFKSGLVSHEEYSLRIHDLGER